MSKASQELLAKAKLIPSNNLSDDLSCLSSLYSVSKIYFEFCLSRFSQLLTLPKNQNFKPKILNSVSHVFDTERNEDYYLPFLDLILIHQNPQKTAELIYRNLYTEKCYAVSYFISVHSHFNLFLHPLLELLFKNIPSEKETHIIGIRDELLFRYITTSSDFDFALKCLSQIPSTYSNDLYFEFLSISYYLVERKYTNDKLLSILINNAMALSDPNKIIELIIETKLKVPKLFVSWANTTRKNPYKFDESKIIEVGLNQLPPMLRMQMLQKVPNEMSSPRLCRAVKFNKSLQKEIKKRIAKEKDPRQLHDFLLASSEKFSIPNSLPFYYTLLAKWCIGDPNLSHLYLSEFSKLDDKTDIEILTAAVIGLELLSSRYPDTVPLVFPKIRHLMKKCPKVIRIHLLNAIAYAVGSETIDEEFVWNDYHSIRTVSEDGLDFDDLIHYCIIGLNDPDDVEIAKPLLDKLCKKDKISVISGLLRLPYEKVSHFNSLISLLPEKEPIVNSKTDILAEVVNEELQKPMTTSRMLQLATAFTMFFDVFKNVTVEWIKILVEAGECVFNMSVSQSIIERCLATIASKDIKDERIRFSCGFSLALYLSYRLIDEPNQISQILHNITPSEKSDLVQLIYLYTLSLCPAPSDAESFIIKMIADGKRISSTNVLFGVGYCIQSWFSSILTFFNKPSNRNLKSIGVWPFASNVLHFLNRDFEINTNDKLGLAQFIYLQRSNPSFDTLIDNLIEKEELDSETLLCAICGYIPDLAFRITSFSPDERQRTLISHVQDLNELTNQLITRQRLYHKQQSQQKVQRNIRPMIEQLRSDYEKLTNNEVAMILSSLSKTQIGEIVNDTTSDCSIFVAIKLRSIDDISRLISMKRQNEKYLNLLKNEISEENLILIVEKMIEINAPIERIAEVLVYYRFDELLAEVNCVAIAPILIAEMKHIKIEMVMSLISNYKEIADDFIKCLLLKKPQFFQQNNEVFELIK